MTRGIRARLRGGHNKGSMSGFNVEETSEQTYGRETEPTARGKGRKDKSRDALANMEARLAMADTREGVDLIEQGMEKGLKDLREQIQDLREGVLGSQVQPVSHEEFMSFQGKVMSMFASVELRMEALATRMKALTSGSLVVVPFFSFLYWSYQPHWGGAGQLRHKAVWAK